MGLKISQKKNIGDFKSSERLILNISAIKKFYLIIKQPPVEN